MLQPLKGGLVVPPGKGCEGRDEGWDVGRDVGTCWGPEHRPKGRDVGAHWDQQMLRTSTPLSQHTQDHSG